MSNNGRGQMGQIATRAGLSSTSISQIFSGQKPLSLEHAQSIAKYLGLPKLETEYFFVLVQLDRAGTSDLKKYFRERRDQLKQDSQQVAKRISKHRELTDQQKARFYSSALYSMIHLYTSLAEGKTLTEISQRFNIAPERAQNILQFLLDCGLSRFAQDRYHMSEASTHIGPDSAFLVRHHCNWRLSAMTKAESLSSEELMFTANISISKKDFPVLREALMQCVQGIVKTVKSSPPEELANLNIDLFWV